MQEEAKTNTDNLAKKEKTAVPSTGANSDAVKTDGIKTLSEKITDTIKKDEGLLSKILATLTNPLVMIVAIIGIIYWYKLQQKEAAKLPKQKKKRKKLEHKSNESNNMLNTKGVVGIMN